jgi:hypothetical protein
MVAWRRLFDAEKQGMEFSKLAAKKVIVKIMNGIFTMPF